MDNTALVGESAVKRRSLLFEYANGNVMKFSNSEEHASLNWEMEEVKELLLGTDCFGWGRDGNKGNY